MKWGEVIDGVIEARRNKRKGVKFIKESDLLGYPCPGCCLKGDKRFCKDWVMADRENNPCLKVDPSGNTFFRRYGSDND
jgi:hypothetical protein